MSDFDNPLDSGYGEQLSLGPSELSSLRKAGKWGRFISIVGLVMIALGVIVMFIGGGASLFLGASGGFNGAGSFVAMMLIIYGIMFGVTIYLNVLLLQFSNSALRAVDMGSTSAVGSAFNSLAKLFNIVGILLIIYLAFVALFMLLGVGGALMSGF